MASVSTKHGIFANAEDRLDGLPNRDAELIGLPVEDDVDDEGGSVT
jgi:hypothetical protein